ncbi:MAG: dephospho-CoA kinase [Nitrospiraceae bacterium]
MVVVGLTGGLATGKSSVAKLFQECGASIIDADILARQVVEPGKPAWRDIVREFGKVVLNHDKTMNRQALGKIVFNDREKLRRLNAIVHPRVAREQARLTREVAHKDPHAVVVYDAPLLIEAGAHKRMDNVVVVSADRATQIARLRNRDGISPTEALRRIRAQMSLRQKLKVADYIIDSTLPRKMLKQRIRRLYSEMQSSA